MGSSIHAVNHPYTETLVFQFDVLIPLHPAILLEVVVEFLNLDSSQLIQLDVAQLGDDVVVDVVQIVVLRLFPEPWLCVDLIPQLDPSLDRVGSCSGNIQLLAVCDCLLQLFLDLALGLAKDVLVDTITLSKECAESDLKTDANY